ncbi:MAG: hypothetical protein RBR09_08400 [Desulfobulbaceae bacterium]|jgi:hypothetical protein|nr:hypothetical protein [Desulfobulbaceae bacterium]MDY0351260.1 hypothetical protein [Desulfobulbaceae bacterium]
MNGKFPFLIVPLLVLFLVCACSGDEAPDGKQPAEGVSAIAEPAAPPPLPGCRACHAEIEQDANHLLACGECHGGNPETADQEAAHAGLVARPAHPDRMAETCGRCHEEAVRQLGAATHLTLRNAVNLVRNHFGAAGEIPGLTAIPAPSERPGDSLELADDMLRRRCLRCHFYTPGDDYPATRRGTGCAACHMAFSGGRPVDHAILARPTDRQCLSCHYGNFVGADYYGRFDHDFNWEYRTPYTTREEYFRPYGIEYHELARDIHLERGLACIDCHAGHRDSSAGAGLTCSSCHRPAGAPLIDLPARVALDDSGEPILAAVSGAAHAIPRLRHPAHEQYGELVACQVCHAQWAFNDSQTHLLRADHDDYYPWDSLRVQASSEIEKLIEHNLDTLEDELPPAMRDGITGESSPGVWYMGFIQRRWEDILIRRDRDNIIKVFRPILDLHLSYVDDEENVIFDNLNGNGPTLLPYTPHTTGPAGLFYLYRFANLLNGATPPPQAP